MNIKEAKVMVNRVLSGIPAVMGVGIYVRNDNQPSLVINIDKRKLSSSNESIEEVQDQIEREIRHESALQDIDYTIQLLGEVQFQEAHSVF